MKLKARIMYLAAAVLITGCSTVDDSRRAQGSFKYVKEPEPKDIKLQEGKSMIRRSSDFAISDIEKTDGELGRGIDVRSPAQILPLVDGSYISEGSEEITIFFEVEDPRQEDLKEDIWRVLWEYFYENGVRAKFWDKQGGVLITDWFDIGEGARHDDLWEKLFGGREVQVTQRYMFTLEVPESGRRAQLRALLLGHEEREEGRLTKDSLSDIEKRRYTVNLLNGAVGHYEFAKRRQNADKEQIRFRSVNVELGEDSNGLPAFIASASFSRTWDRLALVLSEVGFQIDDRNKSLGTYYVSYVGTQNLWDSIFGDEDLPLPQEKYEIQIGDLKDKTSITIFRENKRALSAETMADIYNAVSDAMRSDILR